jgi:hypothetical protein
MKPMTRAVTVALIQILIVSSLGAKLLYDRRTRPQAWFLTQRYDPNLPIRGRYLSLPSSTRSTQPFTVWYHSRLFCGFSTQWPSSGKYSIFDGILPLCSVVNKLEAFDTSSR